MDPLALILTFFLPRFSSGRVHFSGVKRVDSPVSGEVPVPESTKEKYQQYWGKYVVPKFSTKDSKVEKGGGDEPTDSDADMHGSGEPDLCQDSDPESECSSVAVPTGSCGPDPPLPSKGPHVPLCIQHGKWKKCQGTDCQNCAMVSHDISQGNLHCDDTQSLGSDWESDSEPNKAFEDALLETSSAAHMRSMKAAPADPMTMRTPHCPAPGFYGFPLVPTPTRVAKDATHLN